MTNEITDYIANIVSENILTPIIYLLEDNNVISLICFCDRNITMQEIYRVENMVEKKTGKTAEIIDIREFGEFDRLDIISHAKLIHAVNPMIEQVFMQSMTEDFKIAMEEKKSVIERYNISGTCFLQ